MIPAYNPTESTKTDVDLKNEIGPLKEKVCELNCLYNISQVIAKHEPPPQTFEKIVHLIPGGWQSGEIIDISINSPYGNFNHVNSPGSEQEEHHSIILTINKAGQVVVTSASGQTTRPLVKGKQTFLDKVAEQLTLYLEHFLKMEIMENLFQLANKATYGLAISDLNGNLEYTNKAFAMMHGYKSEDLIGKNLAIFHNEDQLPDVKRLNRQLKAKGSYSMQEVYHTKADGTIFPALMDAWVLKNEHQNTRHLAATAIDITAYKKKEEHILHLNRLLRTFNNIDQLIVKEKDPGSLAQSICTELTWSREYNCSWFFMLDENKRIVQILSSGCELPDKQQLIGDQNFCDHIELVERDKNAILIKEELPFDLEIKDSVTEESSVLTMKISYQGKLYGILGALIPYKQASKEMEQRFFKEICDNVAVAFHAMEEEKRRKIVTSKLKKSEQRLQLALEKSNAILFEYNLTTGQIHSPFNSYRYLGYSDDESPDTLTKLKELVHPDDIPLIDKAIDILFTENTNQFYVEFRISDKDGICIWHAGQGKITKWDINGNPETISGIFINIQKLKASEKKLHQIENLSRLAIENSPIGVCMVDMEGRFLSANHAYETITGYTEEQLKQITVSDITHPDFVEISKAAYKDMERERSSNFYLEKKYITSQRKIIDVAVHAAPIPDERGRKKINLAFVEDITRRKFAEKKLKENEEYFAKTFYSSPLLMSISSIEDGKYIDINKKFVTTTKFSQEDALGRTSVDIGYISPEYRKLIKEEIQQHGRVNNLELKLHKKDGKLFYCLYNGEVIEVNGKKRLLSIGNDITDRKIAEKHLLKAKREAEEANRLKSQFLSNMSHELRTPLNSVIGFSDILLKEVTGNLSQKQRKYTENVNKSGKLLLNLINDLLDLSKIEAGQMELTINKFNLKGAISHARALTYPAAKKKNIQVDVNIENDITEIKADEVKIKEVLYNLLDNAIKFTPENGKVEIKGTLRKDSVHISVIDSGIGVSEKDKDKIFKPFVQADGSTKRKYGGTGLGLMLVKEYVDMHGGKLWLESEVGKGSCFTFTLPLKITD